MIDLKLRYWVFTIPTYYPAGGLRDISFTSNSLEEAKEKMKPNDDDWDSDDKHEIFDSVTREYISL